MLVASCFLVIMFYFHSKGTQGSKWIAIDDRVYLGDAASASSVVLVNGN